MRRKLLRVVMGGSVVLAVAACDPERARELARAVFLSPELPSSAAEWRNKPAELKRQSIEVLTKPEGGYPKPSGRER